MLHLWWKVDRVQDNRTQAIRKRPAASRAMSRCTRATSRHSDMGVRFGLTLTDCMTGRLLCHCQLVSIYWTLLSNQTPDILPVQRI